MIGFAALSTPQDCIVIQMMRAKFLRGYFLLIGAKRDSLSPRHPKRPKTIPDWMIGTSKITSKKTPCRRLPCVAALYSQWLHSYLAPWCTCCMWHASFSLWVALYHTGDKVSLNIVLVYTYSLKTSKKKANVGLQYQ